MSAVAILSCQPNSHPFRERHISLHEPVKIGRSVARARPANNNGIFDCKVLSRNHAMLWYENGTVSLYVNDVFSVLVCVVGLQNMCSYTAFPYLVWKVFDNAIYYHQYNNCTLSNILVCIIMLSQSLSIFLELETLFNVMVINSYMKFKSPTMDWRL